MLELLAELLKYARKLLPLMELYAGGRMAQPARDPATQEFQNYTVELLRANRADVMELRSAIESVNQRLKVVDDQSVALQRELSRIADQQRAMMISMILAAVASLGALITGIIELARR